MRRQRLCLILLSAVCTAGLFMNGKTVQAECILYYSYRDNPMFRGYSGSGSFADCNACEAKRSELMGKYRSIFSGRCQQVQSTGGGMRRGTEGAMVNAFGGLLGSVLGNIMEDALNPNSGVDRQEEAMRAQREQEAMRARQQQETLRARQEEEQRQARERAAAEAERERKAMALLARLDKTNGKPPSFKWDATNQADTGGKTSSFKWDGGRDVVDLSRMYPNNDSQGLMKFQWESIDWRYRNDPDVQRYMNDLWASAFSSDKAKAQEADAKLKRILYDQMRAKGRSPQEIDEFFGKIKTYLTGQETKQKPLGKASELAKTLDADDGETFIPEKTDKQLARELKKAASVKANVSYMASGPQTRDDCVLHAIANGAQVPLEKVNETFRNTVKDLGMDHMQDRRNPDRIVTSREKGGRGGVNVLEELLVAEQLGDTIAVPRKAFAQAISATGKPVITTVRLMGEGGKPAGLHQVVVTGVYRTRDKALYYSVMDSNLTNKEKFTLYITKSDFEEAMAYEGGYVVVPRGK